MINRSTVVGVFDDRDQAEQAVEELRRLGFTEDQIGFAARDGDAEGTRRVGDDESKAGEGAATGAVSGGVIGGIIGAAISGLIPGIGPIIAGGILASVLGGAAVGAAAGGLFGALVGEGVPEDEARYYDEEFRGGRTIVTVRADGRFDEAQAVLSRFGAYDVHSRDRGTTDTGATGRTGHLSATETGTRGHFAGMDDWNTVGPRYRQTWQRQYGSSGRNWEDFEPYYRYSYEMSRDPRYQGRRWNEVETDLRGGYRTWASRSGYRDDDSAWDNIKDSLRDAWDSLTGKVDDIADRTSRDRTDVTDRDRMELREERLDVDKREIQAGEARVRKEVVEEERSVDVPLRREEAYIERHPVSGERRATGELGQDEIRVPIRREVADVEKETVVREEIELGKRTVHDTERVTDTVRREEAKIETTGDVEVTGETGRSTREHKHSYDDRGRCTICGKTRDELAA